ncbi:MAG: response regulator, partial [Lentisphaeraceae bacterium]|nr:response regulator [Lentisphaeraceae bacterium]
DSGIGMTERQIQKLFQPFTQATSETTRQFGGTGLGMTISKKLAKLLGGDLVVSSVYGEGSTFSFSFKFDEVHDTAIFKSLEDYQHSIDNSVKQKSGQFFLGRVLLVEDNKANQLLISKILISLGLSVEKAENGQVACERVLESEKYHNPYDLIFMDMYMPIMGGLEATEELRKQDFKRPIIALTANVSSEDQQECLRAGCDDILGKPLIITELKHILAKHLTCSTNAQNINT